MRVRYIMLLWMALALGACESDDAKLERLETNSALAQLGGLSAQRHFDSIDATMHHAPVWGSRSDSAYYAAIDSLAAAERRARLAQRAIDRFLR